jgi:hypothetical protein
MSYTKQQAQPSKAVDENDNKEISHQTIVNHFLEIENPFNQLSLFSPDDDYGPKLVFEFEEIEEKIAPKRRESKVIKEINGTIVRTDEELISVKFNLPDEITVNFPRDIFNTENIVKFGQPITYKIIERPSGIRYQEITSREEEKDTEAYNKLKAIVDEIKLRE